MITLTSKLKDFSTRKIFVNPSQIFFMCAGPRGTEVTFNGGLTTLIEETPETIISLIKGVTL